MIGYPRSQRPACSGCSRLEPVIRADDQTLALSFPCPLNPLPLISSPPHSLASSFPRLLIPSPPHSLASSLPCLLTPLPPHSLASSLPCPLTPLPPHSPAVAFPCVLSLCPEIRGCELAISVAPSDPSLLSMPEEQPRDDRSRKGQRNIACHSLASDWLVYEECANSSIIHHDL